MTALFVVTCPNDGAFLIQWCTFEDGRPAGSTRGRGETWEIHPVGFEYDGRNVGEALQGDERHHSYEIRCNTPGCTYSIKVQDETVKRYVYPVLAYLHPSSGTQHTDDLHAFVRGASRGK